MDNVKRNSVFFVCLILFILSSCVPYRDLSYHDKIDPVKDQYRSLRTPKTIQPFDKLYIKVFSIDEKAAKIFSGDEANNAFRNESLLSYMVNDSGKVTFPFVGTVKVSGLTLDEAGKKIKSLLNQYISNTDVVVKYIDNRISVLGEVNRQGDYTYFEDKLTIFQAIAMAGGLTRYGNKSKITIMRGTGDKVVYLKADLADKQIVQKDIYYTMPGDVIIVEPLKAITWSYQNIPYTTFLSTITTALAVFISIKNF